MGQRIVFYEPLIEGRRLSGCKWGCELNEGWERFGRRGGLGGCLLRRSGLLSFCCSRSSKVLYLFRFFCLGIWGGGGAEFAFFLPVSFSISTVASFG